MSRAVTSSRAWQGGGQCPTPSLGFLSEKRDLAISRRRYRHAVSARNPSFARTIPLGDRCYFLRYYRNLSLPSGRGEIPPRSLTPTSDKMVVCSIEYNCDGQAGSAGPPS